MHKKTVQDSKAIAIAAGSCTAVLLEPSPRLEQLAHRIDAAILARLADPSLSRMAVAARLSVSPRQTSRALASAGGFRSRVRALCVHRATELLLADATVPVKVIAYTVGLTPGVFGAAGSMNVREAS